MRGEKNKQDPINYDEVDYLPDIAVGRWPVSTPEEARLWRSRPWPMTDVLGNASPDLHRAAFIATGGWVDSRQLMDQLAAKLTGGWQLEKRYYSDAGSRLRSAAGPRQVRGLLNEGVGLVVHAGHGQPDGWDECFSVGDLDHITNALRLAGRHLGRLQHGLLRAAAAL